MGIRLAAQSRLSTRPAVCDRDAEWRVFAAVTAVDECAEFRRWGAWRPPFLTGPRPRRSQFDAPLPVAALAKRVPSPAFRSRLAVSVDSLTELFAPSLSALPTAKSGRNAIVVC